MGGTKPVESRAASLPAPPNVCLLTRFPGILQTLHKVVKNQDRRSFFKCRPFIPSQLVQQEKNKTKQNRRNTRSFCYCQSFQILPVGGKNSKLCRLLRNLARTWFRPQSQTSSSSRPCRTCPRCFYASRPHHADPYPGRREPIRGLSLNITNINILIVS